MILPRLEVHPLDHCTMACEHCSHAADIARRRTYTAADYQPWLIKLRNNGIRFSSICAVGGEPFLHPDFPRFLNDLQPFANTIQTMTNLFWLKDEESIHKYHDVFVNLNLLSVTYYKPYTSRVGGLEAMRDLVGIIKHHHPHLRIEETRGVIVDRFANVQFCEPDEVVKKECPFRNCLNLLHDGLMIRCCFIRRMFNGEITDNPFGIKNLAFDLSDDWDAAAFNDFISDDFPDVCNYCNWSQGKSCGVVWAHRKPRKPPEFHL